MSIKEAPLIKAVSRSGAWPEFFFTNPVVCGFMPMPICALAGAFAVVFIASLGAAEHALELYLTVRIGAIFGLLVGFLICLFIALRAIILRDDAGYYARFMVGNIIGVATLTIVDLLTFLPLTAWLDTIDRIQ